jgi:hypothetical protein
MKVLKASDVRGVGQRRYPWKKWFAKRGFSLKKGIDFTCTPYSMSIQIRNRASQEGKSVGIRIEGDTLTVKVS